MAKSGEYTGWHKDPQITVQFDKDDITLELNDTTNVNGWTLRLKYFPAKVIFQVISIFIVLIIYSMKRMTCLVISEELLAICSSL